MDTALKILGIVALLVLIVVGVAVMVNMSRTSEVAAPTPVQADAPSASLGNAQGESAPAAPANPVTVTTVCPTEREFEILTGVRADIVREEICAFHWRGDPATITAAHPCPDGWSCTLGSDGQNYVYEGDSGLGAMQIFAGTWRLVDQYPANDAVRNSCAFLKKVQAEGQISDPQWTASAGNFSCP